MSRVDLSSINFDSDIWSISDHDNPTIKAKQKFSFNDFKSESLKVQIKRYFKDGLLQKFIKQDTLNTYNNALRHFAGFLDEFEIELNYFDELIYQQVMQYVWYLNQHLTSPGTRGLAFASMKAVVTYGQMLGLKRYPEKDIFPANPSRLLQVEDELVSKEIPLEVMDQIVEALKVEEDPTIKLMIQVAKDTGMRLSELLSLRLDSLVDDFMDNPYLYVYSIKQDKDRVIPIRNNLAKAIKEFIEITAEYRGKSQLLFIDKKGRAYSQNRSREMLTDFIVRHNITDPDNQEEIYHLTWHPFRHSLGTDALNSGIHPQEVKELLGHNSWHSTSIYAKIRAITLKQEYKKIGFVGVVTKDVSSLGQQGQPITPEVLKAGALPDGVCRNALDGDNSCKKFNKCLLCPKFITALEYLDIHKQHLVRIREDRAKYMDEMYICNIEKVARIELALEVIIEQLEALA